jgi:hypothetical protein
VREYGLLLSAVCAAGVCADACAIMTGDLDRDLIADEARTWPVDRVAGHHASSIALCSPPSTPLRVFVSRACPYVGR